MITLLRAWWYGVEDGWEQPFEWLSTGLTWWGNDPANKAYERGIHFGQWLGQRVRHYVR